MFVSHLKKQLINFVVVCCFLYVAEVSASQEALVTLTDGSKASAQLVNFITEKLGEIKNQNVLYVLAMASRQSNGRMNLNRTELLKRLGLFNKDQEFVDAQTKHIIALSTAFEPTRLVSPIKQEAIQVGPSVQPDFLESLPAGILDFLEEDDE
jgi:hypothetical protein